MKTKSTIAAITLLVAAASSHAQTSSASVSVSGPGTAVVSVVNGRVVLSRTTGSGRVNPAPVAPKDNLSNTEFIRRFFGFFGF